MILSVKLLPLPVMGATVCTADDDVGRHPKALNKRKMLTLEELKKIITESNVQKTVRSSV